MLQKSYVKFLIVIIVLGGCKTSKLPMEDIERDDFCQISNQLIDRLQKDEKLKSHFDIENESVKLYLDTIVENGIPFFFHYDYAEKKSKEQNISIDETYSQIEFEMYGKPENKFRTNCIENQIERKEGEIQITFWYYEKENLVSLDAKNILKEPGYSIGYLYLVEVQENGKLKEVSETFWVE